MKKYALFNYEDSLYLNFYVNDQGIEEYDLDEELYLFDKDELEYLFDDDNEVLCINSTYNINDFELIEYRVSEVKRIPFNEYNSK